jgi:cellular nucleic acid-binding protein
MAGKHNKNANSGKAQQAKTQKTCINCGKVGHLAENCRSSQKKNNCNGKTYTDPDSTKPDELCYIHAGSDHKNNVCTAKKNIWSPLNITDSSKAQTQKQKKQQNTQERTDYKYCGRCNTCEHNLIDCNEAPFGSRKIVKCSFCKNLGHTHSECRHPNFCAQCRKTGHSTEACTVENPDFKNNCILARKSDRFMYTKDAVSVWNADQSTPSSPPQPHPQQLHATVQTAYRAPVPQTDTNLTRAYFANAKGEVVLEAPLDEVTQQIAAIAADNEAARRHAIAAKCCGAHARYNMRLLNGEITSGERFFGSVDPANPQIQLPANVAKTAALERLFQFWINDSSWSLMASFVRKGWNFFRDPRVLDAIARSSTPVCHGCGGKGHIMSATFMELFPGTDVLTVEDYDMWGPSVMFSCQCSLEGYSFLQDEDGKMDLDL